MFSTSEKYTKIIAINCLILSWRYQSIIGFHSHKLEFFFWCVCLCGETALSLWLWKLCDIVFVRNQSLLGSHYHRYNFTQGTHCFRILPLARNGSVQHNIVCCVCVLHLTDTYYPLYWFLFRHSDKRKILQKKTFNMFCGDVWLMWESMLT